MNRLLRVVVTSLFLFVGLTGCANYTPGVLANLEPEFAPIF